MEVVSYQNPQSWSDKGMTWDAGMNPVCVDYAVAIREAIYERITVANRDIGNPHLWITCNFSYTNNFVPLKYSFFVGVRDVLRQLAPYFVNLEYQDYKEDFSDAPKYWTWRDLNSIQECRICEIPSVGCAATEMVQWMIRAKNYLNKLLVCKALMKFKSASGSHTVHCTLFSDAYRAAIKKAKDEYDENYSSASFYPAAHSRGFGAYENNVPVGEEENNFCSTAGIQTIWDIQTPKSEEFLSFEPVAILVADTATNQGFPHEWTVMQRIVWDNGGFGVNRGVTIKRFSSGSPLDIITSSIPANKMKPRNKPAKYYATSIGMWGTAYFFKDYGVSGGFKFRP